MKSFPVYQGLRVLLVDLGFEDPNSFFRAFHDWTGDMPERVRAMLVADSS